MKCQLQVSWLAFEISGPLLGKAGLQYLFIQKGRHGGKFICFAREWLTSKVLGYWFTGPGKFTLV